MQHRTYMETSLWRRASKRAKSVGAGQTWDSITTVYGKFWERVCAVTQRIAADLPDLTLHNEAHLSALWRTADQIAGEKYEFTPLEVFSLGMAICIHDIAHTPTIYRGGFVALKSTVEWRDAIVEALQLTPHEIPDEDTIANPPDSIRKQALFHTLRRLHAQEAEQVLSTPLVGPDGIMWLLDDDEIRAHMADIVGKIAASHHWNVSDLPQKLGAPMGAPRPAQGLGELRPLKVACLLRVADACQIDQLRANDFAMALHAPTGVSRNHWLAQNRLAPPIAEGNTLIFRSTKPFQTEEADAWWTARSLIQLADKELQSTDTVLSDNGLPRFRIRSIAGATSPRHLQQYIQTKGWHPLDADLRISDADAVIEMLGGEALYGNHEYVPLREILQNAADAIECRNQIEPFLTGKIVVHVEPDNVDGVHGHRISIFDNGVGMSESVMSTTLVDFGESLKKAGKLRSEYESLRGKRVWQRGRYGIGFFSLLMVSKYITVLSKRFDRDQSSCRKLRFRWGDQKRPLLLEGNPNELGGMSTCVSIFLSRSRMERSVYSPENLGKFIAQLAPCLDCDIWLKIGQEDEQRIHSGDWQNEDQKSWLACLEQSLSGAENNGDQSIRGLTLVMDNAGRAIGRAALRVRTKSPWAASVAEGGLYVEELPLRPIPNFKKPINTTTMIRSHLYCGVLPVATTNASRREYVCSVSDVRLAKWAEQSLASIIELGFQKDRDHALAVSAYIFGADPLNVAVLEQDHAHYCVTDEDIVMNLPIRLVLARSYSNHIVSRNAILQEISESIEIEDDAPGNFEPRAQYDLDEVQFHPEFTYAPSSLPELGTDRYLSLDANDDMSLVGCLIRALKAAHGTADFTITRKELPIARLTITRGSDTEHYDHNCPVLVIDH